MHNEHSHQMYLMISVLYIACQIKIILIACVGFRTIWKAVEEIAFYLVLNTVIKWHWFTTLHGFYWSRDIASNK